MGLVPPLAGERALLLRALARQFGLLHRVERHGLRAPLDRGLRLVQPGLRPALRGGLLLELLLRAAAAVPAQTTAPGPQVVRETARLPVFKAPYIHLVYPWE